MTPRRQNGHFGERRGPLGALAGVPGLTGALVRAAALALVQAAGIVLLAAGLARAVADVADASVSDYTLTVMTWA
ncbi:MAG: cydD, partial [Modestobacter sp.]|nr:cydD [Modestobacter sp.]